MWHIGLCRKTCLLIIYLIISELLRIKNSQTRWLFERILFETLFGISFCVFHWIAQARYFVVSVKQLKTQMGSSPRHNLNFIKARQSFQERNDSTHSEVFGSIIATVKRAAIPCQREKIDTATGTFKLARKILSIQKSFAERNNSARNGRSPLPREKWFHQSCPLCEIPKFERNKYY